MIVNGEKIEQSLVEREMEVMRPSYEQTFTEMEASQREKQLVEWSKENVIERVLLQQAAREYGGPILEKEIELTLEEMGRRCGSKEQLAADLGVDDDKLQARIELQMRVDRLLRDVCKDASGPSQEDIKKYYDENKERFKRPEQVRVAHIVKHVNWQADENSASDIMRKALDELAGGASFESLVGKYSDCADNGGDLGYITRGQMVEEFEDVVFNLDTGQVSGIFQTRFGFHIAKLYDRKKESVPQFGDVKVQIAEQLRAQGNEGVIEKFVDELKSKATIEQL